MEASRIDLKKYSEEKWYLTIWRITNVLPLENRLEKGVAAFPEEIPKTFDKTLHICRRNSPRPISRLRNHNKGSEGAGRNSIGYEIDLELKDTILKKINCNQTTFADDRFEVIERSDAKKLRTFLQEKVRNQGSVVNKDAIKIASATTADNNHAKTSVDTL